MGVKKARAGFTLIEVMMVVGLISLVMGSVLGIFITGHMAWNTGQLNSQVQQQARHGMDAMVRELHLSQHNRVQCIDANTLALQIPLNATALGGDGRSRIDIEDGNLIWGAEGNEGYWVEYLVESDQNLNRNVLKRKVLTAIGGAEVSETILAYYIQSIAFTADQISTNPNYPQGVKLTLTAARGASSCSLTTMVFFKN